ncbi:unnamed protein product [Lactuca virosa]|uniref:Nucleoplasmin-like domain-containing protein n=1 Tax=Lactuca virosa TaxID=75947 RepID=A0AAU9PAR3_9ASTR|nr:unnamed protein product [Lactuca virosa]
MPLLTMPLPPLPFFCSLSATMKFWGLEVKNGESHDVILGKGNILKLSLASLGEIKEEIEESVSLNIIADRKKIVVGTLHSKRQPQQSFQYLFSEDFRISHDRKHGSVYFYGIKLES